MEKNVYFNFPVELLKDFLIDKKRCLKDFFCYALWAKVDDRRITDPYSVIGDYSLSFKKYCEDNYSRIKDYELLCDIARLSIANIFFKINTQDYLMVIERGKELVGIYNKVGIKSPFSNISLKILKDFNTDSKTEWENVVLLAFLGVRSIIGDKPHCRITYDFLFSRMAGERNMLENMNDLPEILKKYNTDHYRKKIREDLELNWGMKSVSGRGFHASFDMELKELIKCVEKLNRNYKLNKLKENKNKMKALAIKELEAENKILK